MLSMAMWMAAIVGPAQAIIGDLHGVNTYEHQPTKVAAMEGHFDTERGAAAKIFGIPDAAKERLDYGIGIPHLASLYLAHDWNAEIKGLKAYPKDTWPTNLPLVFFAFRVMVGLGFLIVGLGLASLYLRMKHDLYDTRWFLKWAVLMGPAGFLAVTAGWIVTEAGRQPFTVYGLLRTADSVGPVQAPAIAASLAAFAIVYFVVFGAGIGYLLYLFRQTPEAQDSGPQPGKPVRTAGITPAPAVRGDQHGVDPSGMPEGAR
jgi:cytochrome d ubiquinol oxidase subunit I